MTATFLAKAACSKRAMLAQREPFFLLDRMIVDVVFPWRRRWRINKAGWPCQWRYFFYHFCVGANWLAPTRVGLSHLRRKNSC